MFMVVVAVLSIVLAFEAPVARWLTTPAAIWAAVAGTVVVPVALARRVNGRVLRTLEQAPAHPGDGQFVFGRGMFLVQWALGILHVALLTLSDWSRLCRQTPVVGDWPVVPSVLTIVPFLLTVLLVWVSVYPADRAVRQIALEVYLFRGKPIQPVWRLVEFLKYKLRHEVLFILVPMLLIVAARDIIWDLTEHLRREEALRAVPDLLIGLAAVAVAIITPELLRHVWITQRLPQSPLRDRLETIARQLRVRCREILVWRAGGSLVNAAVMGIFAPIRYVLITDAMIEQMADSKIEAVFGHELGHIKRGHILYLLLFALISGCLITIFSLRSNVAGQQEYQLMAALLGGLLLLKWSVGFGWISRRFERQADIYGARTLALAGLPCVQECRVHGAPATAPTRESAADPTSAERDSAATASHDRSRSAAPAPARSLEEVIAPLAPLCRTAAHLYGATLHDVALLNGIPPESPSWRHGSIAARARTVQQYALDHTALLRFEHKVWKLKVSLLIIAALCSLWASVELGAWGLLGALLGGAAA